jgi:hypothetical protein
MQYSAPRLISMDEVDKVATSTPCAFGSVARETGSYCAIGDQAQGGYCSFGCDALFQISGAGPGSG